MNHHEKYKFLEQLFYENDPANLGKNIPKDEYSPEIKDIMPKLKEPKTEQELFEILEVTISYFFGEEYVELAKPANQKIAKAIFEKFFILQP